MAEHAEFGRKLKQVMADISTLTDMVMIFYPSPNNSFHHHMTRQLDRARAGLEMVRGSAEEQMQREYPHSFERDIYRGKVSE